MVLRKRRQPRAPLTITNPSPLPRATTGAPYSYTFTATGGSDGLQWRMVAGELPIFMPPGLGLEPGPVADTVELVGIPTEAATFHFTMEVADNADNFPDEYPHEKATKDFELLVGVGNRFEADAGQFLVQRRPAIIQRLLEITSSSPLPPAVAGIPYSYIFRARGGLRPLRWRMVGGSLPFVMPPGLDLQIPPLGTLLGLVELFGTPTQGGVFHFVMEVADSDEWDDLPRYQSATKEFTLVVSGVLIEAESAKFLVRGFPALIEPSSYSFEATPAHFLIKRFTALLHDLWITNDSDLPEAIAGVEYSYTFTARGGRPPLQWRMVAGELPIIMPPGLGLEPGADPDTVDLVGIPTEPGTFHFIMEVADKEVFPGWPDQVQKDFTLVVTGSLIQATPGEFIVRRFPVEVTHSISKFQTSPGEFLIRRLSAWIQRDLYITSESLLPPALVGIPYSFTFRARGGENRLQWRMVIGTLVMPPGLNLEIPPLGAVLGIVNLEGIPTQAGNYSFTMQVADNAFYIDDPPYQMAWKDFTLTVSGELLDARPGKFVVRGSLAQIEVFPKRHELEAETGNFVVQRFPAELVYLSVIPGATYLVEADAGNFTVGRFPAFVEYVSAHAHVAEALTSTFVVRRFAAELNYAPPLSHELVATAGRFTVRRSSARVMWLWASAPGGEEPPPAITLGFSGAMSEFSLASDMMLG